MFANIWAIKKIISKKGIHHTALKKEEPASYLPHLQPIVPFPSYGHPPTPAPGSWCLQSTGCERSATNGKRKFETFSKKQKQTVLCLLGWWDVMCQREDASLACSSLRAWRWGNPWECRPVTSALTQGCSSSDKMQTQSFCSKVLLLQWKYSLIEKTCIRLETLGWTWICSLLVPWFIHWIKILPRRWHCLSHFFY